MRILANWFLQEKTRICVPVTAPEEGALKGALAAMKREEAQFDLIEWRADKYRAVFDREALKAGAARIREAFPEKPVIFTLRTNKDMENFEISDEDYENINLFAASERLAELIDVEYSRGEALVRELSARLKEQGRLVICSRHERSHTPETAGILESLRAQARAGADLVKYAAMPRSRMDVLRLMEASVRYRESEGSLPLISMSMGAEGVLSRIGGSLTGSVISFGTAGAASAPGQLPAAKLRLILSALGSGGSREGLA